MRISGFIKSLTFALLAAAFCCAARADLVWTPDRGWVVEGGVLANVLGEAVNVKNALEAMNEGKKAQDEGDNWLALGYYQTVVRDYPDSIFAPEAYFQLSKVYLSRGQFWNAYESLQEIVKRYPDYPRFDSVIGAEYNVASTIQSGATPYLWGWFPWFSDYNDASTVTRLTINGKTVLMTGDAAAGTWGTLVERCGAALKSDILQVPHHGAAPGGTVEAYDLIDPDVLLWTAGDNLYAALLESMNPGPCQHLVNMVSAENIHIAGVLGRVTPFRFD